MDKYEYRLKAEQIEKLVKKKDYKTAAKIADTIDWRRVKNLNMLYIVSEIYEQTERYGECMEILDIAYDRAPVGRMLLYRMTEVCTKMHNFEEAISLYREFVKAAPHDQSRYILKYQIYRERGSSVEDQIRILAEYKTHEYQEKWAYELAMLYDEADMGDECVRECDELILWFSEGEYVTKALELKQKYEPLTAAQQEKYIYQSGNVVSSIKEDDFEEPAVPEFNTDRFSTVNLQAELAENLGELLKEDATIELPDLGFDNAQTGIEPEIDQTVWKEDGTIELPDLGLEEEYDGLDEFRAEEEPEKAVPEEDLREDKTIELPDLGLEENLREDATIELPDLGLEEEYDGLDESEAKEELERSVPEEVLREDKTIELPDLGLEEAYDGLDEPRSEEEPEKATLEEDLREDKTIELPDLGLEEGYDGADEPRSEEEPEKATLEEALREDKTIELPDLGLEEGYDGADELRAEEGPEKAAPEEALREDKTIELPDLGLEEEYDGEDESGAGEEPEKAVPEEVLREDKTIELPDLGLEDESDGPEAAEGPEQPSLEKDQSESEEPAKKGSRRNVVIELPLPETALQDDAETEDEDQGEISMEELTLPKSPSEELPVLLPEEEPVSKVPEEEPSSVLEESEKKQYTGQEVIDEILNEWENMKVKTEAKLQAGARKEQKRREQVKQETEELMKVIQGISELIPEDVQQILAELDEERYLKNIAAETEDDLPPDVEEESGKEEEEFSIDELDVSQAGSAAVDTEDLQEDTTSGNMIQDLERSLASKESEKAVNDGHLTRDQARLFAYFTSVKGMSEQLSVLFKGNARRELTNSSRGNLTITGERGNGKTTLAIDIVKALQRQDQISGRKMAKISGQKLNTKDIYDVVSRLKGGALIIESAGGLSDATMMALSLAMESDTGGLLFILEDSMEEIQKIFHRNSNFASKFDHTIDIPVFTNDELVAFGRSYALEQGYSFDEFGILALYDRIGSRQTNDHLVTVAEVKDVIDGAIERAEKGSIRHLFERVTKKSVDESGNRLLREVDFQE